MYISEKLNILQHFAQYKVDNTVIIVWIALNRRHRIFIFSFFFCLFQFFVTAILVRNVNVREFLLSYRQTQSGASFTDLLSMPLHVTTI